MLPKTLREAHLLEVCKIFLTLFFCSTISVSDPLIYFCFSCFVVKITTGSYAPLSPSFACSGNGELLKYDEEDVTAVEEICLRRQELF